MDCPACQTTIALPYQKDTLIISKLSAPVIFDGLSNEEAWHDAFKMDFTVLRPVWGADPAERTEMYLGFDDEYLYLAGRCLTRDSSTLVIRNLVRDGWRGDDWVTFHIDTRLDKQNALVFSLYPLGSRYDAAINNDGIDLGSNAFNQDFNMFWDAKSVINSEGWFFEIKIPIYNLRLKEDKDGKIYVGISAARILQHHQETHIFPAIPQEMVDAMSRPSAKQPAILNGVKPQKLLLFTPYLLTSRLRQNIFNTINSIFEQKKTKNLQAGLDAKIGLSSYLTMDLSLNPDFAQVEADNQLINLTRFSLFFPEQRLFFQEAAGLFHFGLGSNTQLFYSRQIGINDGQLTDVYGGIRITGKLNKNTDLGFLNMHTAPTITENGKLIKPDENFTAMRVRRKVINERSFVGLMTTNRYNKNSNNFSIGLDGLLNPFGENFLLIAIANTIDSGQKLSLKASRVNLQWDVRKQSGWFGNIGYTFSGRDFNPRLGFLDRSNFHQYRIAVNYGKFAKSKLNKFQYTFWNAFSLDAIKSASKGDWESVDVQSMIDLTDFRGNNFSFRINVTYEYLTENLCFGNQVTILPGEYLFAQANFNYSQPRAFSFRQAFSATAGSFFDGTRIDLNYNPILSLGKHWEIQCNYNFNILNFQNSSVKENIHILRLRINYALNLHLSINYIAQYNSTADQIFNNLRLRYNFKDGHDFYLVWNENFFTNRSFRENLFRPLSGNQSVILKYNYTLERIKIKRDNL